MLLAPGILFRPTDTQLVNYYLKRKLLDKDFCFEAISELDVYKFAPWDLPYKSCLDNEALKWYFFCPVERKDARRMRSIRATEYGYWKVTGKDKAIYHNKDVVGMKKTLIFYFSKGFGGDGIAWVMHEYRLEDKDLDEKDAYVLCVVFLKGTKEDYINVHNPSFDALESPSESSNGRDTLYKVLDKMLAADTISMESPFVLQSPFLKSSPESGKADALHMMLTEMLTNYNASMESSQLSDDIILSTLERFTHGSTKDGPKTEDESALLAHQVSLNKGSDELISTLESFMEDNNDANRATNQHPVADEKNECKKF